jgi:hypothetical protein
VLLLPCRGGAAAARDAQCSSCCHHHPARMQAWNKLVLVKHPDKAKTPNAGVREGLLLSWRHCAVVCVPHARLHTLASTPMDLPASLAVLLHKPQPRSLTSSKRRTPSCRTSQHAPRSMTTWSEEGGVGAWEASSSSCRLCAGVCGVQTGLSLQPC